jgi:hypothetical protein
LGALRVPDVAHSFLVCPALFPRFAQAARGRFARLDPPLRKIGFRRESILQAENMEPRKRACFST